MGSRRSKFYEDMLMCMALETEESEDMEESDGDEVSCWISPLLNIILLILHIYNIGVTKF